MIADTRAATGRAPFARRLQDIEPFRVVGLMNRALALNAAGADVISMAAGEPDFTTAQPIVEAGCAALRQGLTQYSEANGLPALREALSQHYQTEYGLDVAPQRIFITPGASGALLLVAALLLEPGRGMLLADPGYPCNRHFMRLVEGRGELVPVDASTRYQLTADLVAQHWGPQTCGAMLASPANPTGTLLQLDELSAIAQTVAARRGHLVVDEIYHGLVYDGPTHSVLEVDPDAFVVNSFSKYFGMTGWRLGWLIAPEAAVPELERLVQNLFLSLSTMAQHAALAAFHPATRSILDQRREIFRQRRDFLLPAVRELGFDVACEPEGAFYLYADAAAFTDDSEAFCHQLLEQHQVALTPGADFGQHRASTHLRFAFTTGMPQLETAVERLRQALR